MRWKRVSSERHAGYLRCSRHPSSTYRHAPKNKNHSESNMISASVLVSALFLASYNILDVPTAGAATTLMENFDFERVSDVLLIELSISLIPKLAET